MTAGPIAMHNDRSELLEISVSKAIAIVKHNIKLHGLSNYYNKEIQFIEAIHIFSGDWATIVPEEFIYVGTIVSGDATNNSTLDILMSDGATAYPPLVSGGIKFASGRFDLIVFNSFSGAGGDPEPYFCGYKLKVIL